MPEEPRVAWSMAVFGAVIATAIAKPVRNLLASVGRDLMLRRKIASTRQFAIDKLKGLSPIVGSKSLKILYAAYCERYYMDSGAMLNLKAEFGWGKTISLLALACSDLPLLPDKVLYLDFSIAWDGCVADNLDLHWQKCIVATKLGLPEEVRAADAARKLVDTFVDTQVSAGGSLQFIRNGFPTIPPDRLVVKGGENLVEHEKIELYKASGSGCSGLILIDGVNFPDQSILHRPSTVKAFFESLMHWAHQENIITIVTTNDEHIANVLSSLNGKQKSMACPRTYSTSRETAHGPTEYEWNNFDYGKNDIHEYLALRFGYDEHSVAVTESPLENLRRTQEKYRTERPRTRS